MSFVQAYFERVRAVSVGMIPGKLSSLSQLSVCQLDGNPLIGKTWLCSFPHGHSRSTLPTSVFVEMFANPYVVVHGRSSLC
jgi:hypothetical protein